MLILGRVGAVRSLEALSMIPTLTGLVVSFGGLQVLRAVAFPLAYLFLMLPVWIQAFSVIQPQSQELSAGDRHGSTSLVWRTRPPPWNDSCSSLGHLDVMPECSGINQVIALTVMALPAAYLWLNSRSSRVMLVTIADSCGVSEQRNSHCRTRMADREGFQGQRPAQCDSALPGFVTVSLAYLAIWAFISLVAKTTTTVRRAEALAAAPEPGPRIRGQRLIWVEVATVFLMVCVGAGQLLAMPAAVPAPRQLQSLPARIDTLDDGLEC